MTSVPGKPRVAVIGLDGAEPTLVEELMESGAMPALARLRQRGAYCRLLSEPGWQAGRVWESFLTGEADFPSAALFDPATYESFQLGSRHKRPFYMVDPPLNLLALDVPYMSLQYPAPGAQVVWGGHDTGYPRAANPPGLVREIDARFGVHPAFHNDFGCPWYDRHGISALTEALVVGSRRRVDIAAWLMERFPDWDLFMTVPSEVHSAGEIFWHGLATDHPLADTKTGRQARKCLLRVYRELDRAVERLIALLPEDTTVMVVSVHGMQINNVDIPSMALLPELLYRAQSNGTLLHAPDGAEWARNGYPLVEPPLSQKWGQYMRRHFGTAADAPEGDRGSFFDRWRGVKRSYSVTERPIPPETDLPPDQIGVPKMALDYQPATWYREHWPRMRAFALPVFYDGRVRINLRGREAQGTVAPEDYEATCAWVEELLGACRNPRNGEPAVEKIERLRADDPLDPDGPDGDLIVTWRPNIDALQHPDLGIIGPVPYRRTGGHTASGFAIVDGADIPPHELATQESLALTPTVLDLLGRAATGPIPFRPG